MENNSDKIIVLPTFEQNVYLLNNSYGYQNVFLDLQHSVTLVKIPTKKLKIDKKIQRFNNLLVNFQLVQEVPSEDNLTPKSTMAWQVIQLSWDKQLTKDKLMIQPEIRIFRDITVPVPSELTAVW